jgi:hypothetical protein
MQHLHDQSPDIPAFKDELERIQDKLKEFKRSHRNAPTNPVLVHKTPYRHSPSPINPQKNIKRQGSSSRRRNTRQTNKWSSCAHSVWAWGCPSTTISPTSSDTYCISMIKE